MEIYLHRLETIPFLAYQCQSRFFREEEKSSLLIDKTSQSQETPLRILLIIKLKNIYPGRQPHLLMYDISKCNKFSDFVIIG